MIEKVSTEEKEKNYTQETKQSIYKKDVQAEDKESQVSPAKNDKKWTKPSWHQIKFIGLPFIIKQAPFDLFEN